MKDIYLKFGNPAIKGESADKDHAGWIEIERIVITVVHFGERRWGFDSALLRNSALRRATPKHGENVLTYEKLMDSRITIGCVALCKNYFPSVGTYGDRGFRRGR